MSDEIIKRGKRISGRRIAHTEAVKQYVVCEEISGSEIRRHELWKVIAEEEAGEGGAGHMGGFVWRPIKLDVILQPVAP